MTARKPYRPRSRSEQVKVPEGVPSRSAPGGKQIAIITPQQVERLAMLQCTLDEAAACLFINPNTFRTMLGKGGRPDQKNDDIADAWARGQELGKASLRRRQHRLAMSGHPTMLIWLGKQYLGQKDATEQSVSGDITIKVVKFGAERDEEAALDQVAIEQRPKLQ